MRNSTLPSDKELRQLTKYICGSMSDTDAQAFDDRLADDDAFFDRIAPMLKIWYAPPPSVIKAGEELKARLGDKYPVLDRRRR
jgi:hypothetical protein